MLHLLNLEEIEALLLKVPALVRRFEDRDPDFIVAVNAWLRAAEEILSNNRLALASEIAVYRGALLAAERGFPGGTASTSRSGARQAKQARAAGLLQQATDAVSAAIQPRRAQMDEAERVMLQAVAIGVRLGLIPAESGREHTAYLQSVLQAMLSRAELASLLVHVTGLLGSSDTLVILDRALSYIQQ